MKSKYLRLLVTGLLFTFTTLRADTVALVADINRTGGWNNSSVLNLVDVNGTLFFRADDGVNGNELWKSDGTTAGTVLVKDIYPGANYSFADDLVNVNGTLFF